jgi:translation initiation factor 6
MAIMIRTLDIYDNPVIGVFATCTEDVAVVPLGTNGSTVVGSLCRGNSKGFVITGNAGTSDLKDTDLPVRKLPGRFTAAGNIILANDSAALVHPEMSDKAMVDISETLGVDVHRGTIAGIKTVGMAGVASNNGLLVHPRATQEEIGHLEEVFGLPVDIGTTNFGTQMVGSGLLVNSKGYVAGSKTTGYELGRIEDALGFV